MRGGRHLLIVALLGAGCTTPPAATPSLNDLGAAPDLLDCKANPAACGLCTADIDCAAPNPRCHRDSGKCVPCLPESDNCGPGSICVLHFDGYACETSCNISNDCIKLAGGGICCAGACRNTTNDVLNCGACGRTCPAYSYAATVCSGGTCTMGPCMAGRANCNQSDLDGCETDTETDPNNCGGCGVSCGRIAGGTIACVAGKCVSTCNLGWTDCNGDLKDGCEVDTTGDPDHCGGCATVCTAPPNASPACDSGKCSFRCKLHFFDCDGEAKNGCELDATADPLNCGHCGNVCPLLPNAAPACQAALCGIGACTQGYSDCDRKPGNGCETQVETDVINCGACGNLCAGINGGANCANGLCTLTCNSGFDNCNNKNHDGCEVNLKNDANNCGACGNICPVNAPNCSSGVCGAQPMYVGSFYVEDGDFWFFDPPTYTCQEACALIYGGVAASYKCSTDRNTVNRKAWASGYGDDSHCADYNDPVNDDYKAGSNYDCGFIGCSYSAYVFDNCIDSVNYCFQ